MTEALVAVCGLNQGSKNVNWRRLLVVNPNFREWAKARGVGREDHEFGTAPGGVLPTSSHVSCTVTDGIGNGWQVILQPCWHRAPFRFWITRFGSFPDLPFPCMGIPVL
jgi:hypothetical protein